MFERVKFFAPEFLSRSKAMRWNFILRQGEIPISSMRQNTFRLLCCTASWSPGVETSPCQENCRFVVQSRPAFPSCSGSGQLFFCEARKFAIPRIRYFREAWDVFVRHQKPLVSVNNVGLAGRFLGRSENFAWTQIVFSIALIVTHTSNRLNRTSRWSLAKLSLHFNRRISSLDFFFLSSFLKPNLAHLGSF